jgi:aminoglycoside phosphotransferase (APT) family kinase protein
LADSQELREGVTQTFVRRRAEPPRDLAIGYVRFKPGTSCLLGLHDATRALEAIGYVKVFLSGDPSECFRKYRAREKGDGWAELLPELRAVFFRFPLDRNVIGLRTVSDAAHLKHVIHDSVPGLSPHEERVRARKSRVGILKYKPERRCVAGVELGTRDRAGESRERRLVAQAYGDDSGARVYRVMRHLWARPARGTDGLCTPRPLGYHAARRILLQEWRDGEPWGTILAAADAVDGCIAAARNLRALHALDPGDLPDAASPEGAIREGRRVLEDLARIGDGPVAGAAVSLARELAQAHGAVRHGLRTIVHGDFHYHQLLMGPDGPTLIDWDEAGVDDPRLDVGNFLAHLHLAELERRVSADEASRFRSRFLENYLADRPPVADLPFFTALQLAKLAMVPFRNLADDWSDASLAILDRAHGVLTAEREVAA